MHLVYVFIEILSINR